MQTGSNLQTTEDQSREKQKRNEELAYKSEYGCWPLKESELWRTYQKSVEGERPPRDVAIKAYANYKSLQTGATLFGRPCTPIEKRDLGSPLVNVFEEGRIAQKTPCSIPTVVVKGFDKVNSI